MFDTWRKSNKNHRFWSSPKIWSRKKATSKLMPPDLFYLNNFFFTNWTHQIGSALKHNSDITKIETLWKCEIWLILRGQWVSFLCINAVCKFIHDAILKLVKSLWNIQMLQLYKMMSIKAKGVAHNTHSLKCGFYG